MGAEKRRGGERDKAGGEGRERKKSERKSSIGFCLLEKIPTGAHDKT